MIAEAAVEPSSQVDTFENRLAELVVALGGPTAAAQVADTSRQTINQWSKGNGRPSLVAAHAMTRKANLSLDWLMGGETSGPSRMAIRATGSPPPEGYVPLPVLRVSAAAGSGRFPVPSDLTEGDGVAFQEAWLRSLGLNPSKAHVLWASGDSMATTIRDGDMMLVDRTIDRIVNDGIYVVVAGGAVKVKRVYVRRDGSVVLRSDNNRYPEELVPAGEVPDLIVEGRVRWVGGPI